MCRRIALATAAAALALVTLPRAAEACSPGGPWVSGVTPEEGATYPANAAIVFEGASLSESDLEASVEVDGSPAILVRADALAGSPGLFGSVYTFQIEPTPTPGQTVQIEYCESPDYGECASLVTRTYTAGPPDTETPQAPTDLTFDVHEFPLIDPGGGACVGPADTYYYVRFTPTTDGGAPVMHIIEGAPSSGGEAVFNRLVTMSNESTVFGFRRQEEEIDTPAEACVRVQTIDLALNEAEVTEVCGACRLRQDDGPGGGFDTPDEPDWTTDDIIRDGPCDDGDLPPIGDSSGVKRDGCGCAATSGAPGAGALALLVLLGFVRRSRSPVPRAG